MSKNLLVFADGTGNQSGLLPDESRTNVYKLFRATRSGPDSTVDPNRQIAFYVPGVGTSPPGSSRVSRLINIPRQMMGLGLIGKIVDCYVAIISVWEPGDRIYLFGFSRGAYTARCVAHVLEVFGIPTRRSDGSELNFQPSELRKIAKKAVSLLYPFSLPARNKEQLDLNARDFIAAHACSLGANVGAVPYMIGIWDAVAAIGWQRVFPMRSYDYHFPKEVRFARHAQAIDEFRSDFVRVPWGGSGTVTWQKRENEPQQFSQVWFAGNHSDIGGSYPENESRLSDIALKWMADFITQGLPEEGRVLVDDRYLTLYPNSNGLMHDECMVGIGGTPLRWNACIRQIPSGATLHETVYERLAMKSVRNFTSFGPYRPASLANHEKAKSYFVES